MHYFKGLVPAVMALAALCAPASHAMEIVFPASENTDSRLEYPLQLLELALSKSGQPYTLVPKQRPESNKRLALLMQDEGTYDVAFFGTRPELEENLRPIRFPIHRGLLGNRVAATVLRLYTRTAWNGSQRSIPSLAL